MDSPEEPAWAVPQTGGRLDYRAQQLAEAKKLQREHAIKTGRSLWHPNQLAQRGWYHSLAKLNYASQAPVQPWLCYPALDWLERKIHAHWQVAEWGTGLSSLWWAQRVHSVVSCEHDPEWFARINAQAQENMRLELRPLKSDSYLDFVRNQNKSFDVVVVDAKRRVACMKRAIDALGTQGLLIFDDSQKVRFYQAWPWLALRGFHRCDFWGPKAQQAYCGKTSIFSRDPEALLD